MGELVYDSEAKPPHRRHDYPNFWIINGNPKETEANWDRNYPVGSVWRCECGELFVMEDKRWLSMSWWQQFKYRFTGKLEPMNNKKVG